MCQWFEKIIRDFLWEGVDEGSVTSANRDTISRPLEVEGLGIGNLRLRNEALLAK